MCNESITLREVKMMLEIPREPVTKVLLDLNAMNWGDLEALCKLNKISRTDAVNEAIKYMLDSHWIPGRTTKKGVPNG